MKILFFVMIAMVIAVFFGGLYFEIGYGKGYDIGYDAGLQDGTDAIIHYSSLDTTPPHRDDSDVWQDIDCKEYFNEQIIGMYSSTSLITYIDSATMKEITIANILEILNKDNVDISYHFLKWNNEVSGTITIESK